MTTRSSISQSDISTISTFEELRKAPQWVCYTPDKEPINPHTGYGAKCNDPSTWTTYEFARLAAQQNNYAGIGYEFVKEQGITGIDLDKCIDEEGNISPFAQEIVERLNSYTEYSPSGQGLHIWVRGNLPDNIDPNANADGETRIEMYDCKRYFTITGKQLSDTPETFEDRQIVLLAIYQETLTRRAKARRQTPTVPTQKREGNAGDTRYGMKALELECSEMNNAQNGSRNTQLNKSAYAMGQLIGGQELTRATVEQALTDAASRAGLDDREIEKTLRSGLEKGMESPRAAPESFIMKDLPENTKSYPCTDLGNAERFAARYRDTARWCEIWNSWMIFNGRCWEKDRSGRIDQFAKMTTRAIYGEAERETDDQARVRLAKHAANSESNRSIRAMLDRAKSELPIVPENFNQQLHLLNCKNGTLDLHNGELRPHSPSDFLTRCLKVDYNPLATAPRWENFVTSIFAGDTALIDFVHMSLGMSLSGDISEQCWFLCHGGGSNGKTTLTETVRVILEDYGLAANIESFQAHKGERINNDIAEFYGARLITASENQVGSRLNEAFIKKITGNEPLRARRLHENEFQFMPECTIWLSVNHKPVVKDTSKGMWRRVHYIPFIVTIEDNQIDKDLPKKLLEESEGILAWIVQGCLAWYRQGRLVAPEAVKAATQAYKEEMDFIALFLSEKCIEAPGQSIKAGQLYETYKQWCLDSGERFETNTGFGLRMGERGYKKEKTRKGIFYLNLTLIPDHEGDDDSEKEHSVNSVNSCEHLSDFSHEEKIQGDLPLKSVHNYSQEPNPSHIASEDETLYKQLQQKLSKDPRQEIPWNATERLQRSAFSCRVRDYLESGSEYKRSYALKLMQRELGVSA